MAGRGDVERRGRRQLALLWGAAALSLVILSPLGPWLASLVWACPFKELTGLPCPACGSTRAALHLGRFDFLGALSRYPLQTLFWFVFLGGGLVAGALALAGRDLPALPRRLPRWMTVSLVAVVLANWAWSIATGV